jgi:hypothetical protein
VARKTFTIDPGPKLTAAIERLHDLQAQLHAARTARDDVAVELVQARGDVSRRVRSKARALVVAPDGVDAEEALPDCRRSVEDLERDAKDFGEQVRVLEDAVKLQEEYLGQIRARRSRELVPQVEAILGDVARRFLSALEAIEEQHARLDEIRAACEVHGLTPPNGVNQVAPDLRSDRWDAGRTDVVPIARTYAEAQRKAGRL